MECWYGPIETPCQTFKYKISCSWPTFMQYFCQTSYIFLFETKVMKRRLMYWPVSNLLSLHFFWICRQRLASQGNQLETSSGSSTDTRTKPNTPSAAPVRITRRSSSTHSNTDNKVHSYTCTNQICYPLLNSGDGGYQLMFAQLCRAGHFSSFIISLIISWPHGEPRCSTACSSRTQLVLAYKWPLKCMDNIIFSMLFQNTDFHTAVPINLTRHLLREMFQFYDVL